MAEKEESGCSVHNIKTEKCGEIKVSVQGELDAEHLKDGHPIILTVHDMGSNNQSMIKFINHPSMINITSRTVFLHVVIPGQDSGAEDLGTDFHFPTMQDIGEDLVCVLDQLKVPFVVGLGEGAGANILARFGMAHPTRCLGLALVHPTSTTAGVMEHFKDKIITWKLDTVGHNPTAEQYLVFHKFGEGMIKAEDKQKALDEFKEKLHSEINPRNLHRYVDTFMNRTDISGTIGESLMCDTLILVGDKSSFLHSTETFYQHTNKAKTSILRIDDVGDVLTEAPGKVSQALILFCQGIGLLTSISIVERNRSTSNCRGPTNPEERRGSNITMEQSDIPNADRFFCG